MASEPGFHPLSVASFASRGDDSGCRRRPGYPQSNRDASWPLEAVRATAMPPDTAPILLRLEELLSEQLTLVGKEAYRRRLEIEAELADVRLQLARLGVEPSK